MKISSVIPAPPHSPNILDLVLQYDLSMSKPSEISGKAL